MEAKYLEAAEGVEDHPVLTEYYRLDYYPAVDQREVDYLHQEQLHHQKEHRANC